MFFLQFVIIVLIEKNGRKENAMRNAAIRHAAIRRAGATYDIEGEYPFVVNEENLSSSEVLNTLSKFDPEDYDAFTIICDELDMEIFPVQGAWVLDGINGPLPQELARDKGFYSLQDALEYVDILVDGSSDLTYQATDDVDALTYHLHILRSSYEKDWFTLTKDEVLNKINESDFDASDFDIECKQLHVTIDYYGGAWTVNQYCQSKANGDPRIKRESFDTLEDALDYVESFA